MPLRVQAVWSGTGGGPYLSTFHFLGSTQTDADNAVTAVSTFLGAIDNSIDIGLSWATNSEVVNIDIVTGQPAGLFNTTPGTGAGSASGTSTAFAAQGLLRLRTGQFEGGREIRGRLFIPHLVQTADGVVSAATITAVNAAAAALIADANSQWVVYSRTHQADASVLSATLWNQFAVLRSRRPSFG